MTKVPCIKCGAMILEATAGRTGGLCMSCTRTPTHTEEDERAFQDSLRPARAFAALWKAERQTLLDGFLGRGSHGSTHVSQLIEGMNLDAGQKIQLAEVLESILTDTMYRLLLGLDGCASIGDVQAPYELHDENGALIQGLEIAAYEEFHSDSPGRVLAKGSVR
jgi:hypothetical protein